MGWNVECGMAQFFVLPDMCVYNVYSVHCTRCTAHTVYSVHCAFESMIPPKLYHPSIWCSSSSSYRTGSLRRHLLPYPNSLIIITRFEATGEAASIVYEQTGDEYRPAIVPDIGEEEMVNFDVDSSVSNKGLQNSPWPKGFGNLNNTGHSQYNCDIDGNVIWAYKSTNTNPAPGSSITKFYASPVIDVLGNIIIGKDHLTLLCISRPTVLSLLRI